MPRLRWVPVLVGAATFLAAHAIEVAAHIGGDHPWFISALPSAMFTLAAMFASGVLIGRQTNGSFLDVYISAMLLAGGAALPLVLTIFTHPGGPGNLFPLALMLGIVLLACTSIAGVAGGWLLRRAIR